MLLRRGDVVLVDFTPTRPAKADYLRPAVVVTNNQAVHTFAPVVMVVPLTSSVTKIYPVQLFLPAQRSGGRDSKTQVELLRHVTLGRVQKTLSQLSDTSWCSSTGACANTSRSSKKPC